MSLTLYTFSPNTIIKSAEVNANFNALNGSLFNIDEDNFNPGAQLPDSLLAQITTPSKVSGAAVVTETLDAVRGQFTWTISGDLAVGVNAQGFPLRPSCNLVVISTYLEVLTAPTGAALIINIKKNGTTIYTTKPQIDDGSLTGGTGAVLSTSPLTLAANDKLTLFIDQIGSTIKGSNLIVYLRCKQKVPQ